MSESNPLHTTPEATKRSFDLVDIISARIPMGSRKKSKPETKPDTKAATKASPITTTTDDAAPTVVTSSGNRTESIAIPSRAGSSKPRGQGWYGSWKSKAGPVTQVQRESISGNTPLQSTSPKKSHDSTPSSSPHKYMNAKTLRSAREVPLESLTSTTNVSIISGKSLETVAQPAAVDSPPLPPDPVPAAAEEAKDAKQTQPQTTGWFAGWWSRPDGYTEDTAKHETVQEAASIPLPREEAEQPDITLAVEEQKKDAKSWFWRWSTSQNSQILADPQSHSTDASSIETERPSTPQNSKKTDETEQSLPTNGNGTAKAKGGTIRKSSGWAFWSKDTEVGDTDEINKQVGELAVANTASESHPEAAQFNSSGDQASSAEEPQKEAKPKQKAKASSSTDLAAEATAATAALLKIGSHKKDIILPRFASTYSVLEKRTLVQNLRQYFLGGPQEHPHLHLVDHPRKIKNALSIGVHGFFPNALYQKLLGAPTGTSIKFSNMGAAAIKTWTDARGYDCKIEKAALEGEGVIGDRVETLWKLLLNWMDHIRAADFILFNCHSQGVPVTVMLVDRLIKFGCVSHAKIGICAMAGVSLGPFLEYKTQLFGRSALELFDFSNPASKVSVAYRTALAEVLRHNVKIVFTGSLDDQLVSLESSTFSNISHPCIYRAAFIDGRHFTSDFITELVGFALKLRNLGLSDHGLIRELSPALAGSLYSGEGHSRLYDSPDVYSLAVSHALETSSPAENTALVVQNYDGPAGKDSNPYFLPWAMRGILEEERVRKELSDEISDLLALFEQWRPTSKQLKDIRYKLEALKSKL